MRSGAASIALVRQTSFAALLLTGIGLWAQPAATLSGIVTGPAGTAIGGATVSITRNPAVEASQGRPVQVQTDASGHFSLPSLPPGEYRVSVSAAGFNGRDLDVTVGVQPTQTLNIALTSGAGAAGPPNNAPTLGELGFPTTQTQANAQNQALLDRRSHMLQMHQKLGLITAIPLVATFVASGGAGGRSTSSATRDLHAALGSLTVGMYAWTASYAIRAPRVPGTTTRGPIRIHKALAWVHGSGMVLTPVLGAMAFDQKSKGEKVHGIASAHGAAAWI